MTSLTYLVEEKMSTLNYLQSLVYFADLSSSDEIQEIIRLAKLDVQSGTKIAELVSLCCSFYPKQEALQKLVDFGQETEENVVEGIFEFQDENGVNCLINLFQMATQYSIKTRKELPSSMLADIEESFFYLIGLVEASHLNLTEILNHSSKGGQTLFHCASFYSETVTKRLLQEDVEVRTITGLLLTPSFRVRLRVDF